ncbi:MAG: hypothetical protein [Circoviridae sp.]|nr:MAG: hypothetical protein [Circoviridae sp.]
MFSIPSRPPRISPSLYAPRPTAECAVPRREERSDLAPSQSSDSERCAGAGSGGIQRNGFLRAGLRRKRETTKHLDRRLPRTFEIKIAKELAKT